jgi:GNAT superfamily N-acetyltransferase
MAPSLVLVKGPPAGAGATPRSGPYDAPVEVELVEFGRLSESQRVELEGDEVDPFDGAGNTLQWQPKDQHVALRGPGGRLIASAGLVLTEVELDGETALPVVGIGGVFVAARYRGQGLSTRVMTEILAKARGLGPDLALLFCHRNRAGLYLRHEFVEIAPPVLVDQPDGPAEIPMVSMWRPLHDGVTLPRGRVFLRGLPF